MPNLVVLSQTVRAYIRSSAGKIEPIASRLSRSLEVIGTALGSMGYLRLSVNDPYGPISYHFRNEGRVQPKN